MRHPPQTKLINRGSGQSRQLIGRILAGGAAIVGGVKIGGASADRSLTEVALKTVWHAGHLMRRIFIFHFFAGQSERRASTQFTEVGRRYHRVLTCGLYVAQRMFYVF